MHEVNRTDPRTRMYGRGSGRHDPFVQWLAENLTPDAPAYGPILLKLRELRELGIELTPEVATGVIQRMQEGLAVPEPAKPQETVYIHPDGIQYVADHLVYYMRVGNRVKIGTTLNLPLRMASLNPEELMALEAGSYPLEKRRHREFAHLRTHGEWFALTPELETHIEQVLKDNADRQHVIDYWRQRKAALRLVHVGDNRRDHGGMQPRSGDDLQARKRQSMA